MASHTALRTYPVMVLSDDDQHDTTNDGFLADDDDDDLSLAGLEENDKIPPPYYTGIVLCVVSNRIQRMPKMPQPSYRYAAKGPPTQDMAKAIPLVVSPVLLAFSHSLLKGVLTVIMVTLLLVTVDLLLERYHHIIRIPQ